MSPIEVEGRPGELCQVRWHGGATIQTCPGGDVPAWQTWQWFTSPVLCRVVSTAATVAHHLGTEATQGNPVLLSEVSSMPVAH